MIANSAFCGDKGNCIKTINALNKSCELRIGCVKRSSRGQVRKAGPEKDAAFNFLKNALKPTGPKKQQNLNRTK
jgi:hypothetical protein